MAKSTWTDHPRACGEQVKLFAYEVVKMGSSPRMRGAVVLGKRLFEHLGIIPAHAGSSEHLVHPRPLSSDHPRACGEQLLL